MQIDQFINSDSLGQTSLSEQSDKASALIAEIMGTASEPLPETRGSYIVPEKQSKQGILYLTEKEIQRMPKQFRKNFRVGKTVAHVRKKDGGVYEIRCTIQKKQISASSKRLEVAKEKFVDALIKCATEIAETNKRKREGTFFNNPEPAPAPVPVQIVSEPVPARVSEPVTPPPVTLGEYMLKWLETVRKPNVKPITYRQYMLHYRTHICPVLGDRPVAKIKPFELQEFINNLIEDGKQQTAKSVNMLLNGVFDYAVIDDIITKSPMLKIKLPHFEKKESLPFSREEEKQLIEVMKNGGRLAFQAYVFMLYTGLRRSEIASVEIDGEWITVISAKTRKGYRQKTRSIPISPMLKKVLPYIDIEKIRKCNIDTLTGYMSKLGLNHHVHELRHTFITRCQECGIRREIVSLWAGHAADSSITSQIYTHLETNKQIQLEEIKKFDYEL